MINNIFEAINYLDIDYVKTYIASGNDLNFLGVNGETPFTFLCQRRNFQKHHLTEIAILLTEAGANINGQNKIGNTPLITCIFYDQIDILNYLIASDCDLNLANNIGNTPLHFAAIHTNNVPTKALIQQNLNPFLKNKENLNPLEFCIKNNRTVSLDILTPYYEYHSLLNSCTSPTNVSKKIKL